MKTFCELNKNEFDLLALKLGETLITGYDPFNKEFNPFKDNENYQIVAEVLTNPAEIYTNLMNVLKAKNREQAYIFYYGTYFKISSIINFSRGFSVDAKINRSDFIRNLNTYNIGNQGDACCYFDSTFTWCIFQLYRARLLTGDEIFLNAYYINKENQNDEIEEFLVEIEDSDFLKSHAHIAKYLKYRQPVS